MVFRRYLFRELIVAAVWSAAILTLIMFAGSTLQFVMRYSQLGLGFLIATAPGLLQLVLPYTIGFGVLTGTTLLFGRLANERELDLLAFNGVPWRVVWGPCLAVGVLAGGLAYVANHVWQPAGFRQEDEIKVRVLRTSLEDLPPGAQALDFPPSAPRFTIAYREYRPDRHEFRSLMILQYTGTDQKRRLARLVTATRGTYAFFDYPPPGTIRFDLENCLSIEYPEEGGAAAPHSIYQRQVAIDLELFQTVSSPELRRAKTFTSAELDAFRNAAPQRVQATTRRLRELRRKEQTPEVVAASAREAVDARHWQSRKREADGEYWRRWTLTVAPLAYIVLGLGLGLSVRQGNKLLGFTVSLLVVVALYYPLVQLGVKLTRQGAARPELILILPTGVLVAIGLIGLWYASRPEGHGIPWPWLSSDSPDSPGAPAGTSVTPERASLAASGDSGRGAAGTTKIRRARWRQRVHYGRWRLMRALAGTAFDRAVLVAMLGGLVMSFVAVLAVFVTVDATANADFFTTLAARSTDGAMTPTDVMLRHYRYALPMWAYQFAPMVGIVAALFTVTRLSRHRELAIVQGAGVSVPRALRSVVLVIVVLSLAMLAHNQWGVPYFTGKLEALGTGVEHERRGVTAGTFVDRDQRFIHFRRYSFAERTGYGVIAVDPPTPARPPTIIEAPRASFVEGAWRLSGGIERTLEEVTAFGESYHAVESRVLGDGPQATLPTDLKPSQVGRRRSQVLRGLSISELARERRRFPDDPTITVAYHLVFVYPFAPLILVLFGLPLILNRETTSFFAGLGLCLLLALGYYAAVIVVQGLGMRGEVRDPALVLWGMTLGLMAIGIWRFRRTRS